MERRNTILKIVAVFLLAFSARIATAQIGPPPIPAEIMFGNERLDFQLVLKRDFTSTSKFSLLAIGVFSENYDKEKTLGNSIVIPVQVNYSFGNKGFAVSVGAEANSNAGFKPTLGFQHVYASRKLLALTVFSFLLSDQTDAKIFGLYEFKPSVTVKWNLYTRLQFVYNGQLSENLHNRSFLYLRAGLKNGPLAFGLGANWDEYGSNKLSTTNFGVFTRWDF